jgi:hypothetical protein
MKLATCNFFFAKLEKTHCSCGPDEDSESRMTWDEESESMPVMGQVGAACR